MCQPQRQNQSTFRNKKNKAGEPNKSSLFLSLCSIGLKALKKRAQHNKKQSPPERMRAVVGVGRCWWKSTASLFRRVARTCVPLWNCLTDVITALNCIYVAEQTACEWAEELTRKKDAVGVKRAKEMIEKVINRRKTPRLVRSVVPTLVIFVLRLPPNQWCL